MGQGNWSFFGVVWPLSEGHPEVGFAKITKIIYTSGKNPYNNGRFGTWIEDDFPKRTPGFFIANLSLPEGTQKKKTRRKFAVSARNTGVTAFKTGTPMSYEQLEFASSFASEQCPEGASGGTEQLGVLKKPNPTGRRSITGNQKNGPKNGFGDCHGLHGWETWSRKSTQVGNEFFFKLRKFLRFSFVFQQILSNLKRFTATNRDSRRLLSMPLFVVNPTFWGCQVGDFCLMG